MTDRLRMIVQSGRVCVDGVSILILSSTRYSMADQPQTTELTGAALVDSLLERQDDVIRQLDELEKKLIATIEEIRPSKQEDRPESEMPADGPARRAA